MLHPHVPEGLKHFGKHLFATFLGLLMALGLEQWREHHVEARRAEESLACVEAELRADLARVEQQLTRCEMSIRTADALDAYFDRALEARRRGRPLPALPKLEDLGVAPTFATDAWETLKGLGALRHIAPDRIRRLSRAYVLFSTLRQNFDTNPVLRQIPATLFLLLEKPECIRELDTVRLAQTQEGIRLLRYLFRWTEREMQFLREACREALKP